MSNNSKKRPYRERRDEETGEIIAERIPKKNRGGNGINRNTDRREGGVMSEEEMLDPVAEARKALEMFEEVSGESIAQIIPKKVTSTKTEVGPKVVKDNQGDLGQISKTHKNTGGRVTNNRRLEGGMTTSAANGDRNSGKAGKKQEDEEERLARQRKRIEVGEARRREFRPKIAGLQDSNCLL
jgi:hypothetical protein